MIKKSLHLVFIVLFLVGVCLWEELAVNSYLNAIDTRTSQIQTIYHQDNDIQNPEIIFLVENLEEEWKKKETILSVILNHQEVYEIGAEIARLKGSIAVNQVDDFGISLSVIRFHTETFNRIMGLSLQNLF